jgi:predicted NAD-dependent protein-ADP-ribosyltransferase YbiA (DUF1768 family)
LNNSLNDNSDDEENNDNSSIDSDEESWNGVEEFATGENIKAMQEKEEEEEEEKEEEDEKKPKEKKPKEKKPRQIAIPKDSRSFFKARAKFPHIFKFTKEGDLQIPDFRGNPPSVIELPYYRKATKEELEEDEEAARGKLVEIERQFDETYRELKETVKLWRQKAATSSDVVKLQRDLRMLDAQRTELMWPTRWIKEFKSISINKIFFDNPSEDRKIPYPLVLSKHYKHPLTQLVRIANKVEFEATRKPVYVEEEIELEETPVEEFVYIDEATNPEYGLLSPEIMLDLIYNSTKYTFLLQAYEVERVTRIGRKDMRGLLLRQKTGQGLRTISTKVVGQVENPKELLIDILKAYVGQHKEIKEVLEKTRGKTIVYANPRDTFFGVGLAEKDIVDRSSWKGENLLGQAWQAVRESLGEIEDQVGGNYTEEARTEDDIQAEKKKGYFIGLARKKKMINF